MMIDEENDYGMGGKTGDLFGLSYATDVYLFNEPHNFAWGKQ